MNKMFYLISLLCLFLACKEKPVSLKEITDQPIDAASFVAYFPPLKLTYKLADTSLDHKKTDSLSIHPKILHDFIPDSVFTPEFGKKSKLKFFALGSAVDKGKETYLLLKASAGKKKVAYLAVFDKEDSFLCAMPLLKVGFDQQDLSYGALDNKFQITAYREKMDANSLHYKRNIYIYNRAANVFTLIMTEPNEEIIAQIIDPIDTLAQEQPFSGNYIRDKKNFVTIRDGSHPSEMLFFVHFEKLEGSCVGELKGTMKIISKNQAKYQEPGNTCALLFTFEKNEVKLKELGGCGAFRDIKCFFDGSFPMKHKPKKKPQRVHK